MSAKTPPVDPAIERTRKRIVWGFGALLALLFGSGLLYALGVFDRLGGSSDEYTVIEGTTPPARGMPITVVEYFSYSCPHCKDFDPQVEAFREDLPAGVVFKRVPIVFGAGEQELQARTYYALEAAGALDANHPRIFKALHEEGRRLDTDTAMADLVAGHGIEAAPFLRMVAAGPVRARVAAAQEDQRRVGITSIPTLVVGGHWRIEVANVGRARAIEVARELVQQVQAGAPAGAGS